MKVADPTRERPEGSEKKRSPVRELAEWAVILVGALLFALLVKTFLFQAFYIPSESMVPTLHVHDRVLVNKLSYRFGEVERGDLVVFERPANMPEAGIKDLVKRVIAVGGETIESRGEKVYVDEQPLIEPYRASERLGDPIPKLRVPAGSVFVMGDNRTASSDSRVFGPIDEDLIVGRAFIRFWPLGDLGLL